MGGAHHALAPSLYKSLNYNIQKDFVPVALVAQPPQVVVINASKLPVKTLQEFIDYAKKRPGDINFGTAGRAARTTWPASCSPCRPASSWWTCPTRARGRCCRR